MFSKNWRLFPYEKNSKTILLPRPSHPTRDFCLPVARPEVCWTLELGVVPHGPCRSISKFVIAYLSNKSLWKVKFDTIKANHIQNVICPAVVVILALKNQLFDNTGKV